MSTELTMLGYAVVLGVVQLLMATQAATAEYGLAWNLSPRDQKMPELTGVKGRIHRALKNFLETFPFFIGAAVLVLLSSKSNSTTALGAQIYFWCRVIYVPIYIAGIPVIRTLVWLGSIIGIALMLTVLI